MVCDFFFPRLGGVENHIWNLSQHLSRLGHKVVIITHAYCESNSSKKRNETKNATRTWEGVRYLTSAGGKEGLPIKVYYCPFVELVDQDTVPTFMASLPLMRQILIRERIDVVHGHQATSTMASEGIVYAAAMSSSSDHNLASVYTDHSLFGFDDVASVVLNRVLQTTLATVDQAICVSHVCRDNLILRAQMKLDRCGDKVRVIPNAVDPSQFTPPPRSSASPPASQANRRMKIVIISRLVYRKGVDLLVGIIPNVCRCLPDVDFIVGGDGSKMLALQEMVERERLEDRVEFLGAVQHSDVRNVLVRGDVFLNCSLTESFCIAILEAASCGLLVVSTNVGGVPEVLPPDMILLSDPTVPDLVDTVRQAISNKRNGLGLDPWVAHERITRMYSWHRIATETVQVYERALQRKRRSFVDRIQCYYEALDGGMSGLVVCLLAVTLQLWLHFVEWWQPRRAIDVVPDYNDDPGFLAYAEKTAPLQRRSDAVSAMAN